MSPLQYPDKDLEIEFASTLAQNSRRTSIALHFVNAVSWIVTLRHALAGDFATFLLYFHAAMLAVEVVGLWYLAREQRYFRFALSLACIVSKRCCHCVAVVAVVAVSIRRVAVRADSWVAEPGDLTLARQDIRSQHDPSACWSESGTAGR